jgi:glycosyltransferase involved in cell wall biosynthesis
MLQSLTSVVIPAYNRADYLPTTVESALGQEGAEVEVIVVDDGSTDDTPAVVERHRGAWGERFRYVRQENAERCVARNHGLALARGEFVAFLDSDDLWRPNHVRACVEALRRDESAPAAYGEHGLVDASGRVIRDRVARAAYEGERFKRELCLKRLILFPTEVVVRRAALDAAYGSAEVFDPEAVMLEEWLVWVTLLRSSPSFARAGVPTAWRRLHPNSTWGNPEKFARQSVRATEKVIETGLPAALGVPAGRIRAINLTHCAYGFYLAGDWPRARGFLVSAVREHAGVLRETHFWQVAARLCVGKRLSRAVRGARHRGGGELAAGGAPKRADL